VRTHHLDPATARVLEAALHSFGEYYAAGALVGPASDDKMARLESVLAALVK
jgi:hypothetical protein